MEESLTPNDPIKIFEICCLKILKVFKNVVHTLTFLSDALQLMKVIVVYRNYWTHLPLDIFRKTIRGSI